MHCGASMREFYGPLAFHIYATFPTCVTIVSFPTGGKQLGKRLRRIGGERLGKRRRRISNVCQCSWSNITWVCANLGFIVHPSPVSLLWNDSYLALSPQVTVYSAWTFAEYIQLWNQNSLSFGAWSQDGVDYNICQPFSQHNYWSCGKGVMKLFCSSSALQC